MSNENNWSVYKHTSPSNKVYIGITSRKPTSRWNNGYKRHPYFYSAILKYGWSSFKHEVLFENISQQKAFEIEKELIAKYALNKQCYNLTKGGEGTLGRTIPAESRYRINENRQRSVNQYTKDGIFIKTYASIKMAEKSMGILSTNIQCCCVGKLKTAGGFVWRYNAPKPVIIKKDIICKSRSVIQYDEKGNFLEIYDSIAKASRKTGILSCCISNCCSNKTKRAGGFIWKYN